PLGTPSQRSLDRAVAKPVDVAQPDAAGAERLARPDHDATGGGIEPHDVKRRTGRHAEPAPLPDSKMNNAVVAAEHTAVKIDDFARRGGVGPQALDDIAIMPARHEADVLAVVLVGNREAKAPRDVARLGP